MRQLKYPCARRGGNQAGYTLLEIMTVLTIIAILVGSAVVLMTGNVDAAKRQRVDADFQSISTQLKAYQMLNFTVPTSDQGLQALVKKPTAEPVPRRWQQFFKELPLDPWGQPYQYKANGDEFVISSLGPDKRESDDDIKSQ